MPSQFDYLKIKISEKEKLLLQMIDQGKKDLANKRLKDFESKQFDNPYDRIVKKVQLRQKEDLERIKNNKMLFQENV